MQEPSQPLTNPSSLSLFKRARASILATIASKRGAFFTIILITLLTHLPSGFGSFVADDYMQWAMIKGSPELHELGFEKARPDKPINESLLDGFHFFSDKSSTLKTYQTYGNLLWWSGSEISMVPFRPVAAFTHWLDYSFLGDRLWLHQLHSLSYFLLLAILLYVLYRKFALIEGAHENALPMHTLLAIACLAALFNLVDFSLTRSFLWVIARNSYLACAIGIGSLLCFMRWREQRHTTLLLASLALFTMALLTAEAALAVAGYMGAYVLCMERKPLAQKSIALLPVIFVIVLWRISYNQGDFGALNIAQYVDPARSPTQFGTNFLMVFPLIVLSQITGIDSLIIFLHPEQQWKLILAAWLATLTGTALLLPTLRQNAVARFWFVGSIVAAIPGTALISAESRTMMFVSIGFFYLLAKWLHTLYQARQYFTRRWLFRITLGWHLFLPLIMSILLTSGLLGYSQLSRQYDSVDGRITSGQTGLVIINPDASGMMYYLPFEWAFRQFSVPGRMSVLTTGLETIDLIRVSERDFFIEAPAGMALTHNAPFQSLNGNTPAISSVYAALYTHSFFTTPSQRIQTGQSIVNADTRISILASNNVGPTRIRVEFTGTESPDNKVWQWFDWATMRYQSMTPLEINERRRFWGPLDQATNHNASKNVGKNVQAP